MPPFSPWAPALSRLISLGYWLLVAALAWETGNVGPLKNFDSVTIIVIFSLLLIFMQVIAGHIDRDQRSRQQMRQLLVELETSHRQLQAYADRVAELAAAAERNRLARDIHDSLGHYLTAISIQLEKAQAYRDGTRRKRIRLSAMPNRPRRPRSRTYASRSARCAGQRTGFRSVSRWPIWSGG